MKILENKIQCKRKREGPWKPDPTSVQGYWEADLILANKRGYECQTVARHKETSSALVLGLIGLANELNRACFFYF